MANLRKPQASAPAPGRCGRCRAAMSRRARTGRANRRRSARDTSPRTPTAALWPAASKWCGASSPPRRWPKYVVAETLPGSDVQSDDDLLDYARQYGSTVFHATCTCKMGPDAMAVVDDRLRVHGLQGLRVIDASVMPTVTSTNTNAPTIMIAEKGAAMILEDARQKLAA